jgi:hypothetical protein
MKTRTKKCKSCGEQFTPYNSLQKYCTKEDCVRVWVATEKEKAWKKTKAKKKEELMTVQDYIKLAQQVFNKYIRLRDKDKGCISCGKALTSKFDAGHYFNANNHWNVRFDEDNVYGQCVECNQWKHGNLIMYQLHLIDWLGGERYDALVDRAYKTRKYTIEELKEIIAAYKKKIKELESNQ